MPSQSNKKFNVQDKGLLDFEWSFQPIVIWMRVILGMELNPSTDPYRKENGKFCWSLVLISFGSLILVVSVTINLLSMILLFKTTTIEECQKEGINMTQANLLIILITGVNDSVYNVSIHLVFYTFVLMKSKWNSLWTVLQKIQFQSPKLDREFYLRCRKFALIGTLCNIVNFGCNLYMATTSFREHYVLISLMGCFSRITETLSLSILTVFCVLVWMTLHMFHHLNTKAAELQHPASRSVEFIGNQLENWRRHHALVCQLVESINSCFGIILLIATTHSFVSFITDTFEITMIFLGSNRLQNYFVIRFIQHLMLLVLVCIGSSLVQSEASSSLKHLRQLSFISISPFLQLQLNGVILEVGHTQLNKISATDFFDVNMTLFPPLIGTTLTYLIILYQQVISETT